MKLGFILFLLTSFSNAASLAPDFLCQGTHPAVGSVEVSINDVEFSKSLRLMVAGKSCNLNIVRSEPIARFHPDAMLISYKTAEPCEVSKKLVIAHTGYVKYSEPQRKRAFVFIGDQAFECAVKSFKSGRLKKLF